MQKYGIEIPPINEIPFGSRAIQSGIEVDEIWISRPNTPSLSQRASCTTIMDDSSIDGTAPARNGPSSLRNVSDGSYGKGKASAQSSAGSARILKRSTLSEQLSESTTLNAQEPGHSLPESRSEGFNRSANKSKSDIQRRWSSIQTASDADHTEAAGQTPDPRTGTVYGTAEVFANTRTRRTVSGFEILPAGSLGQRVELHASRRYSEELPRPKEVSRTPNKLHKPRPKTQIKNPQE